MRIVLGLFSGVLGLLAGGFGLAYLFIFVAGPDRDGATAMAAVSTVGPVGAVIGFAVGVAMFVKFGLVRPKATDASGVPQKSLISRPFAFVVVAAVSGLAFWGWWELIRSPYLTRGYMTLDLQFRLPPGMALPADVKSIEIVLDEGGHTWLGRLDEDAWHGHQDDRLVILAKTTMAYKAWRRTITLSMPGVASQSWPLELGYDAEPTPGFTKWAPSRGSPGAIQLNYRLSAGW